MLICFVSVLVGLLDWNIVSLYLSGLIHNGMYIRIGVLYYCLTHYCVLSVGTSECSTLVVAVLLSRCDVWREVEQDASHRKIDWRTEYKTAGLVRGGHCSCDSYLFCVFAWPSSSVARWFWLSAVYSGLCSFVRCVRFHQWYSFVYYKCIVSLCAW